MNKPVLSEFERQIDEIDRQLYVLAGKAAYLADERKSPTVRELARAISRARSLSLNLLPDARRREIRGC